MVVVIFIEPPPNQHPCEATNVKSLASSAATFAVDVVARFHLWDGCFSPPVPFLVSSQLLHPNLTMLRREVSSRRYVIM